MLTVLANPVGHLLALLHAALSTILTPGSGPAWALSIVLLTVLVRLLLFPLFVRQLHNQRRLQEISPQVKQLQKRHKGDRETINRDRAKVFGAPLSAAFSSPKSVVTGLGAGLGTVRLVAAAMVVLMAVSSVYTQRQMLARAGTTDPTQLKMFTAMIFMVTGFLLGAGSGHRAGCD